MQFREFQCTQLAHALLRNTTVQQPERLRIDASHIQPSLSTITFFRRVLTRHRHGFSFQSAAQRQAPNYLDRVRDDNKKCLRYMGAFLLAILAWPIIVNLWGKVMFI